ncbi:MAG: polyprenyl synthetase family protein [Firmicutes bacterium]|nr:polyprenyl synthetase family protein [Bacillota bacterium]
MAKELMLAAIESTLSCLFTEGPQDLKKIDEAMAYSLLIPGKRLRALIPLLILEASGQAWQKGLYPACALEAVHTYSLVHDDLPCMDDDQYRRGKLCNHLVFGEAIGLLAGDGLLTEAFYLLNLGYTKGHYPAETALKLIETLSFRAGRYGMIGGQLLDIEGNEDDDATRLRRLHSLKTGALMEAAFLFGAYLADLKEEEIEFWSDFAQDFGLLFQIQDDLMDVLSTQEEMGKKPGSDQEQNKLTYVSLYGLEKSQALAEKLFFDLLKGLESKNAEGIKIMLQELKNRVR